MTIKGWRNLGPFYFYAVIVVLLLATTITASGISKSRIVILLTLGFLSWGLIEYILHRFVFHLDTTSLFGRNLLNTSHLAHHENPRAMDDLFANLRMSVPIASAYFLIAWMILGTRVAASYLFLGLVAGYFSYEWLHFQAHHGRSRLPVLRYLKKYHLLHHYRTPNRRFGVTSPFFDFFFGTFSPIRSLGLSTKSKIPPTAKTGSGWIV